MDSLNLKLRIGNEMTFLTNEVGKRYEAVYSDQESKRFIFLAAQASLCMFFMDKMVKRNDDWGWVPDFLRSYREEALFRYQEAREEDDQDTALLMLARLRLLTTLVRRTSDRRRALLFLEEAENWDAAIGDKTLLREVIELMGESAANYMRLEPQGNRVRSLMSAAQVFLARGLLKETWDMTDRAWFTEYIGDYIDSETERYRQARFAEDADNARCMLSRVRFATTLYRRLEDPKRRAWLSLVAMDTGTMH